MVKQELIKGGEWVRKGRVEGTVQCREETISSKLFIETPLNRSSREGNWSNVKTVTYKPNISHSEIVLLSATDEALIEKKHSTSKGPEAPVKAAHRTSRNCDNVIYRHNLHLTWVLLSKVKYHVFAYYKIAWLPRNNN
ncbi:hypothetical protein VNO78_00672 [Psophocarpus tetragonolobus]|uniref:Uncharacterized protein n=1 Tax=Psophocarpus tetragonolobus TaxID=3891 RepID=A0AAN9XUS4_PSOTE